MAKAKTKTTKPKAKKEKVEMIDHVVTKEDLKDPEYRKYIKGLL